jgi:hypothetical protein
MIESHVFLEVMVLRYPNLHNYVAFYDVSGKQIIEINKSRTFRGKPRTKLSFTMRKKNLLLTQFIILMSCLVRI